jgi:2-amino-4-hydroxy-6-hydroxymethyldihydropteridine diphosphokinase
VTRVTAYVGLGSNLDRPREQVLAALDELERLPQTRLVSRSRLYRSAPLGHDAQPDFVNAVARIDTGLEPPRLLAELQAIEKRHGRERPFPDAPRTLDLDLLLYGDEVIASTSLTVPHPRMHERAFVLRPLAEICPAASVPGRGTAAQLLQACPAQDVEPMA